MGEWSECDFHSEGIFSGVGVIECDDVDIGFWVVACVFGEGKQVASAGIEVDAVNKFQRLQVFLWNVVADGESFQSQEGGVFEQMGVELNGFGGCWDVGDLS